MTPSELKHQVEIAGHEPYFFSRKTMVFFGDTMGNYRVREGVVDTYSRKAVRVWELYRRKPVKHGLGGSAYFDKGTFKQVFERR